jgi:hypothetical protein
MTTSQATDALSRRTALAGLAAGGLGLALATTSIGASAQGDATDLASHPLAGTWLAMANPPLPESPQIAAPSLFGADGSVLLMFPLTQVGPQGVVFNSAYVGTWEADGERRGHFTAVQVTSDASGAFTGTTTVDGYPLVSEDGQTFIDDGSKVMVTIRDPAGAIVQQFPGAGSRPVTGMRMGPSKPGFPAATPEAGTPTP